MFSFFKKKDILSASENERIVAAIRACETTTSGEIRVYMENKNPLVNPLERAAIIFQKMKMFETAHRNAVLLYVAVKHKEVALFGDSGIHEAVGSAFWDNEVKMMLKHFQNGDMGEGIEKCVRDVGRVLAEKFPYNASEDKNELPDEIVFGK